MLPSTLCYIAIVFANKTVQRKKFYPKVMSGYNLETAKQIL